MKALDGNGAMSAAKMLGPQDKFIEKATEATKKQIKDIEDKISINDKKIGAISKLQLLVATLRGKSSELATLAGDYNSKKISVISDDDFKGDEYIKVSIDDNARVGKAKVRVSQIATCSSKIIGSAANAGFNDTTGPQLNGTLTINGTPVNLLATYTTSDIADAINASGAECEALVIKDAGAGTSYIEIRNKNTGLANTVTLNWAANDASTYTICKDVAGTNAIINVEGIELINTTNKFDSVLPGVDVELTGRVNNVNKWQTLNIMQDDQLLFKAIDAFADAYNELALFVAQQEERVGEYDDLADPTIDQGSKAAKDAHLYGSSLMRDAHNLLEVIFKSVDNGSTVKSIFDIGLGVKQSVAAEGKPSADIIYLAGQSLFQQQCAENLSAICKLFADNNTITSDAGNQGSKLLLALANNKITANFKDIPVRVTVDGSSNITGATATLGANVVNCTIERSGGFSYVVFPSNCALSGIKLYFNPNGVQNHTEQFLFSFHPGLTTFLGLETEVIISSDGRSGASLIEASSISGDIQSLTKQKDNAQTKLSKIIKDIEMQYQKVESADFKAAFQMAAIEAALGLNETK